MKSHGKSHDMQKLIDTVDEECRQWLAMEVIHDPSSSLATRFHHWLVDRMRQTATPTESQRLFLALCKQLDIRCIVRNEEFIYVQEGNHAGTKE